MSGSYSSFSQVGCVDFVVFRRRPLFKTPASLSFKDLIFKSKDFSSICPSSTTKKRKKKKKNTPVNHKKAGNLYQHMKYDVAPSHRLWWYVTRSLIKLSSMARHGCNYEITALQSLWKSVRISNKKKNSSKLHYSFIVSIILSFFLCLLRICSRHDILNKIYFLTI